MHALLMVRQPSINQSSHAARAQSVAAQAKEVMAQSVREPWEHHRQFMPRRERVHRVTALAGGA